MKRNRSNLVSALMSKPELPFTDEEIEEILEGMDPAVREIIEVKIGPDGRKLYRIKPEYFET